MATYHLREYHGSVETRHGIDFVSIHVDACNAPIAFNDVVQQMWDELYFSPLKGEKRPGKKFPDSYYCEGEFDNSTHATFEYMGYRDIPIPDSLVKAIQSDAPF